MTASPLPVRLETARLRLRPLGPADAELVHRLWVERDPRHPPHRRVDGEGHPSLGEVRDRLVVQEEESLRTGIGLLAVERRDAPDAVGYCGLVVGSASVEEPEMAFELLRDAHGQGIATEAARALVEAARETGRTRLWSTVRHWNAASLRVLEKAGFAESGRVTADAEHGDTVWMTCDLAPAATRD
ncbi:Acetyltransferase (GNAT) family protein [Clavibacter michiganensis]|uniref:Acetyltransferase (GNAT) family protein n=1 Tax=Clavibacter michiganensis TaxID=28447 RepID=A0A251Y550_9MICO|nr:GNAT family N-acetyltransferase [Clavibacter michiganensis]OUE19179.1 Acetyltransferase (GNAT) family protein [Clavibacter michiganensis]